MSAASAYATDLITMKMDTPTLSAVEMVQLVLKSYPSMKTERIRTSGAQPMREFSMAEFTLVEKTAELVDREAVDRLLENRSAGRTVTLELPIPCIAATVPLDLPIDSNSIIPPSITRSVTSGVSSDYLKQA